MLENSECPPATMPSTKSFSEALQATRVRMLNDRKAALTLNVLTALSLRPVKGRVSGPRWQEALRLTRQT